MPVSAHAGLFSSWVSFLSDNTTVTEAVESVDYSPVETPLLSTTVNDPVAATGGGEITVEENALVPTGPIGEEEVASSKYKTGEIRVYTVDAGDTLSQIAQMYGVTSNTIMWANDMPDKTIHEGQTLVILPIVGVRHEVAKGETLNSIVKKYEADLDEVLAYNNLSSADDISIGDELMIPGGSLHSSVSASVASRPTPTNSTAAASTAGYFSHPVPGAIRTQGVHGYNGVDLAAGYGTAIRTAAAGEVIVSKSSGWNGGYGQYIVIKHNNGTQTLYAHLSANHVTVGEWVAAGATIGAMGNSGRSTGTHLHFEVRGGTNPF